MLGVKQRHPEQRAKHLRLPCMKMATPVTDYRLVLVLKMATNSITFQPVSMHATFTL